MRSIKNFDQIREAALLLKKYNQVFISLLFLSDLFVIALSWFLAYLLRFEAGVVEVTKDVPPLSQHLPLMVILLLVCGVVFHLVGLYRPRRLSTIPKELGEIIKALTISILIFVFLAYFFKEYRYSRLTILYFWVLSILLVSLLRFFSRSLLKAFRRREYNLRYVLIIGEGELGQKLLHSFDVHSELGLKAVGFLSDSKEEVGQIINGIKVIGVFEKLHKVLTEQKIDQVYIALPFHQHEKIRHILSSLKNELVDIRVVSDLYDSIRLGGGVDDLDGLPIINIQDTPLHGWGKIGKRMLDIVLASTGILILSPLMLVIGAMIKMTSRGPIFYKQKRMGLDGEIFEMLKFRSMVVDAEKETGSVWAKSDDPRRTPIGKILRETSLDELPQLFNVLKGEMSLVGPRPERPELIDQFKHKIPKYMLRHKIKAGVTGWAQVNGWRGNTSLEKRIEHDLYYIENWSISFDLRILFLTMFKGLVNRHAY
jgi:Undecaprenyl-phosphate glucose phosphotransferase